MSLDITLESVMIGMKLNYQAVDMSCIFILFSKEDAKGSEECSE